MEKPWEKLLKLQEGEWVTTCDKNVVRWRATPCMENFMCAQLHIEGHEVGGDKVCFSPSDLREFAGFFVAIADQIEGK